MSIDLNKVIFEESYLITINHETKASDKNPNGPWNLKGSFKVDMKGATIADLIGLAEYKLKVAKQTIRARATIEEARKHFAQVTRFTDVGKKYEDPTAAFEAVFASWPAEKQQKYIEMLSKRR